LTFFHRLYDKKQLKRSGGDQKKKKKKKKQKKKKQKKKKKKKSYKNRTGFNNKSNPVEEWGSQHTCDRKRNPVARQRVRGSENWVQGN